MDEREIDPATGEITTVGQRPEIVPEVLPATVLLDGLRDGQVLEEYGEAIRELAGLVNLHQAKGSVTLTLEINPQPNGMVLVFDQVTMKAPKVARPSDLKFVDKVGNLTGDNPDRPTMGRQFRDITGPPKEPREL